VEMGEHLKRLVTEVTAGERGYSLQINPLRNREHNHRLSHKV
jgi:hypothetical protein